MEVKAKTVSGGLKKVARLIQNGLVSGINDKFSTRFNDNIRDSLPDITGSTINSFTPVRVSGLSRMNTITRFDTQSADLLQRGTTSTQFPSKPYRIYNPDWVRARGLSNKFPNGYLFVGNPSTTYWGREENQWFTKASTITRSEMNEIIKSIKIED